MNLKTSDKEDLIDLLHEAQDHLNYAINLLDDYVRQTNDIHAEACLVDHLKIFAGSDHGFLSSDLNIDDLIEQLDETEDDEEE